MKRIIASLVLGGVVSVAAFAQTNAAKEQPTQTVKHINVKPLETQQKSVGGQTQDASAQPTKDRSAVTNKQLNMPLPAHQR